MKAAVLNGYNKKGCDLEIKDIPVPEISDQEVLVKIHTAGVNPLDNMIIHGEVKMIVPYSFPLIMGNEFVGIIEKTGSQVKNFKTGERVYGRMPLKKIGAFAEYTAVNQNAIAKVPDYLSDEEAACVPLTSLTAMQALEMMHLKPGDTLFISGGTGSLGAMAIPLANAKGLKVVTNGSAANRERVLALGAKQFIDYKKEDYTTLLSDVDGVLDTLGGKELSKEFGILKDGGSLVSLRGMPNGEFARRTGMSSGKRVLFNLAGHSYDRMAAKKHQHYYFIFVHEDGAGLEEVSRIFTEKKIRASVDEVFSLENVNQALSKVAHGKSRGKTVLKIAE